MFVLSVFVLMHLTYDVTDSRIIVNQDYLSVLKPKPSADESSLTPPTNAPPPPECTEVEGHTCVVSETCPQAFQTDNGCVNQPEVCCANYTKEYVVVNIHKSFTAANDHCVGLGGQLAMFKNMDEIQKLVDLTSELLQMQEYFWGAKASASGGWTFIDGTPVVLDVEAIGMAFSNKISWRDDEFDVNVDDTHDCMSVRYTGPATVVNDMPCDQEMRFVCETYAAA